MVLAAGLAACLGAAVPTFRENIMVIRAGRDAAGALNATATANKAMKKTMDRNIVALNEYNTTKKRCKKNEEKMSCSGFWILFFVGTIG